MSLAQGVQFFRHVFGAGPRVLVTTTFADMNQGGRRVKVTENQNIREGGFYPNNLFLAPFSFPERDASCALTHPDTGEYDMTCVFNLTATWVQDYLSSKCSSEVLPVE